MKKNKQLLSIFVLVFLHLLGNSALAEQLNLTLIQKYFLFYPARVDGICSMKDGLHYTTLEDEQAIVKFSYETGEVVDTLFSLEWIDEEIPYIGSYSLSDDEKQLLFETSEESIYRHSFKAEYYVYDLIKQQTTAVYSEGKQKLATLSPDGKKVAFVFENNLYLKFLDQDSLVQLTHDGLKNHILNGEPDWVYEEEFTLTTGYYWSPDSRKIAYYKFDESRVKEYCLILHHDLYPQLYTYKYPKAGEDNALVDIWVYDLDHASHQNMDVGSETDRYIPRMKWLPGSEELCITVLNRRQNVVDLYVSYVTSGKSRILYHEENEKYISEFTDDFVNFIDSSVLIMSEKSGFMHIYRYSPDGELINPVSSGEWEVDELLAIDEEKEQIYFTSTEISPMERHIYRVNLDGTNKEKLPSPPGCSDAVFSKTCAYYIMAWSDANTPPQTALYNREGNPIRMLEANERVSSLARRYHFTPKTFFTVENNEGTKLNCYQILPPKFKKWKSYPVIVFVYGGPESQEVMNSWDGIEMPWMQYLAQEGYIVVCMDNRGTDGRGEAFKKSTYLELGKYETEDQLALVKYLDNLPYADKHRIGIFGWSYGAYMSLLCLTKGAGLLNCGVAVAPVTNWKFYDSVYTERFMRKPEENEKGYEDNSPINFVGDMEGELLLVHGDEDDNVHLQNTLTLIDELVENDKHFDLYIYPGQNHFMMRGNARYHLYKEVDEFFRKNLRP
ncbi:MAG: S9 family peptidase [Bacteroidales bacterium]|nr:S9 family peptidase [Bacteroidales bacterium]